jgi:GGDEF domain-containing protein
VLAAVRGVLARRFLRLRVQELEQELEKVKRRVPRAGSSTGVNVADQAFFKKYLLLEVKRSKRYRYPLALMLVCPDGLEEWLKAQSSPEFQRATVRAEMMAQVASLIRDIDLAVPFARDKLLVFLPNTPGKGAATVARRIVERMQNLHSWPGGTASVGLAGYEPRVSDRANVSFGALVRDATNALKQAQALGGNRAEAAPGQQLPKRSRISLG